MGYASILMPLDDKEGEPEEAVQALERLPSTGAADNGSTIEPATGQGLLIAEETSSAELESPSKLSTTADDLSVESIPAPPPSEAFRLECFSCKGEHYSYD